MILLAVGSATSTNTSFVFSIPSLMATLLEIPSLSNEGPNK
jgi:hypothetical protein